jgi:hypothetical protein
VPCGGEGGGSQGELVDAGVGRGGQVKRGEPSDTLQVQGSCGGAVAPTWHALRGGGLVCSARTRCQPGVGTRRAALPPPPPHKKAGVSSRLLPGVIT